MSNWQTPKTTWGQPGQTVPGVDDFNRIEGNIETLGRYDRAPGYGVASGVNTKTVNLDPAPEGYYEGMCFAFRNVTENTGPVTINVNGLGAKSIKKSNGNDLVPGNLKAGSVYTVRYNGTNFILQGSDASGNATPADVAAGKTFSSDLGTDLVGTMVVTLSAGDAYMHAATPYASSQVDFISSTNYVKKGEIEVTKKGSVRIKFRLWLGSSGAIGYGRIYKNGTPIGTERTVTTTTFVEFTEDFSVEVGDKLQLYLKTNNEDVRVYTGGMQCWANEPPAVIVL